MGYTLVVKKEAREDILNAYLYYEEQQEGFGERFLTEVQRRLDDISIHPEYYGFIDVRNILRDVVVNVFPYVIVYRIMATEVWVYAVHHTGKAPSESYPV